MPQIDEATGQVRFRIVYDGPGQSGRTANLSWILRHLDPDDKCAPAGHSLRQEDGSYWVARHGLLWASFRQRALEPQLSGQQAWFELAVPRRVLYHDERRRACLDGVDGLVFVADSQVARFEHNVEAQEEVSANLASYGVALRDLPRVLQLNKRDLPDLAPVSALISALRVGDEPVFFAVATTGVGVLESFRDVARQILARYLASRR